MVLVAICGCSGSHSPRTHQAERGRLHFVPTPSAFHAQCRSTAHAVGYPVPCPIRVPPGFEANQDGAQPGCRITIICPGTRSGPALGWAFGSTASETTHLLITASPRPLRNYARFVDGPYWYPGMRVRPLARLTINGRRMRAVFVPAANESAYMHHVVLIWTLGEHTYGVGFHDVEQFACPTAARQ
jgi:hypothetical protein